MTWLVNIFKIRKIDPHFIFITRQLLARGKWVLQNVIDKSEVVGESGRGSVNFKSSDYEVGRGINKMSTEKLSETVNFSSCIKREKLDNLVTTVTTS